MGVAADTTPPSIRQAAAVLRRTQTPLHDIADDDEREMRSQARRPMVVVTRSQ